MFLADTNVLSELTRVVPDAAVVTWLTENHADVCTSSIVIGELQFGIQRLTDGQRKRMLLEWFASNVARMNVLSFTLQTAEVWARLLTKLQANGTTMPVKDSLIAASALEYRLIVVTRNTADFLNAGVAIVNPFSE